MMTAVMFIIGVIVVMLFAKIIFKATGKVIGVLINSLIGAFVIFILNIFGLGIPITWLTTLIVGFLGVPGVIIILVLKFIFHLI